MRCQTTIPLLLVLLVFALGCQVQARHRRYTKHARLVRQKRDDADVFWRAYSEPAAPVAKNFPIVEIPANDVQQKADELDRIKVVSSAIRVLPKRNNNAKRYRRDDYEWRKPKKAAEFVTGKLEKTNPTKINIYPLERTERYLHHNEVASSRRPPQHRRIIYYATLPEIVRPPVAALSHAVPSALAPWYVTQQHTSSTPYLERITVPHGDNEIARVHSSLIDVVTPGSSRYYSSSYSTPSKFTIIDMQPPYNYAQSYHHQPHPQYDHFDPLPPAHAYPSRFYDDVRTPPYRYHYVTPAMDNALPDASRKPVHTESSSTVNINHPTTVALEPPNNNTRIIPNGIPVN